MLPLAIPTLTIFKTTTTNDGGDLSRADLTWIDMSLEGLAIHAHPTPDVLFNKLLGLANACNAWLENHKHFGQKNAIGNVRFTYITKIQRTAAAAAASILYEKRKSAAKAKNTVPPSKSLEPGYANERRHYDMIKSTMYKGALDEVNVFSASHVHNLLEAHPEQGDFKTLDMTDYLRLGLDFTYKNTTGNARFVNFIRKNQRFGNMLIQNNGFLYLNGKKCTALNGGMYAMDLYENLFFIDSRNYHFETVKIMFDSIQYNHSSIVAGKDVISAGEIALNDGLIVAIDNKSGHYRPSPENLRECVKILFAQGVNLKNTMVTAVASDGVESIAALRFIGQQRARAERGAPPAPLLATADPMTASSSGATSASASSSAPTKPTTPR